MEPEKGLPPVECGVRRPVVLHDGVDDATASATAVFPRVFGVRIGSSRDVSAGMIPKSPVWPRAFVVTSLLR